MPPSADSACDSRKGKALTRETVCIRFGKPIRSLLYLECADTSAPWGLGDMSPGESGVLRPHSQTARAHRLRLQNSSLRTFLETR